MLRIRKDASSRMYEVLDAWDLMRPHKVFFGLTPDDFRQRAKPYLDARAEIAELELKLTHAVSKRDTAEAAVLELVQGVVAAVKGDPAEGQNGELYAAMGYVPKNQRSTGLTRRRKGSAPEQGTNGTNG